MPERAEKNWPPAVIAGAYRTGVLGVRTLVRRGVRVSSFDCNRAQPGFRSTYGRALLCPDPDQQPEAWLTFMIDLAARSNDKPVLISSADQFVSAIAAHADTLKEYYRLPSTIHLHGLLATKQTQYQLAAINGMPLPRTHFVSCAADVAAFSANASFPCLLKPIHFREWQRFGAGHPLLDAKIAIAKTPADLLEKWHLASAVNPNAVVQEIILGPDSSKRVYLACYARDGARIGSAMFRELRCFPLGFGPATVTEPVTDSEADTICDTFLRRIGYTGICEIELKRDSRDGCLKLIEANPRLTGGGDAAPYAGVDLCWLHYLDLIGQSVTPVAASERSFRHIDLRADVGATIAYLRAGLISWSDVVQSYKGPRAYFDFDVHDWRYSAETIYRVTRSAVGHTVRALISPPRRP